MPALAADVIFVSCESHRHQSWQQRIVQGFCSSLDLQYAAADACLELDAGRLNEVARCYLWLRHCRGNGKNLVCNSTEVVACLRCLVGG